MATLNINILNPKIDLIANNVGTSNSCKTVYTFDIFSTPNANITITTERVNSSVEDYDKLLLDNDDGFAVATANESFIMNENGSGQFRVEIGNVGLLNTTSNEEDFVCNKTKVTVVDSTNNESESIELSRCIDEERCDATTPAPPPDPVIDTQTNIIIYFDASGSMNSTLAPLQTMRDTLLKDVLLPYYNGDENLYNSKVTIREVTLSNTHKAVYEDPYGMLNYENKNVAGKVISLVFIDEADIFAVTTDINQPSTPAHNSSLPIFRNRLNNFPTNYYKGILFQVDTPDQGGDMVAFAAYMEAVKNGTGVYAGTNGLSDKTEVNIKLNTTPAATPTYYKDLIIASLNELGFNL